MASASEPPLLGSSLKLAKLRMTGVARVSGALAPTCWLGFADAAADRDWGVDDLSPELREGRTARLPLVLPVAAVLPVASGLVLLVPPRPLRFDPLDGFLEPWSTLTIVYPASHDAHEADVDKPHLKHVNAEPSMPRTLVLLRHSELQVSQLLQLYRFDRVVKFATQLRPTIMRQKCIALL